MGQVDLTKRADDEGPEVVYVNPDGTVSDEDGEPEVKKEGRGKVAAPPVKRKEWPEELVEEAAKYVDAEFIDGGGDYREDSIGTIYWLDLDHLVEFEKADQKFDKDSDFWNWFRTYRKDHNIEARKGSRKWVSPSFGDFTHQSHDQNYMTSWWGGWGYKASSEATQRLAIAVGAVGSIVSVINDTGKPFKTRLASEDDRVRPTSYTSFDTKEVVVSPQALLDNSISQDEGIEVTAGWGLHEGSHVRFTTQVMDSLTQPSTLRPLVTAAHLLNLLEDVRIESKTSEQFPGFAGYFDKANAYLWDVTKHLAPVQWGPELQDKMNVITASVKWGTEYGQIVANKGDQKLKDEYVWFSEWAERYRIESKDARRSLIEALAHLEEDDDTKQQMQDQTKAEQDREKSYGAPADSLSEEDFKDLLKDLKNALKAASKNPAIEPCPSPDKQSAPTGKDKKISLTPDQAAEIEDLIRQELEIGTTEVGPTANKEKITIMRPQEDQRSKGFYLKPSPMVGKLKSAFVFRKTVPEWSDRAQRSGQLDETDLWKIIGNDLQVFERKITTDTPNTQVTMLVDMSSSMSGNGVRKAQDLANTMLECLKTMRGVTVRIRGHQENGDIMIYKLWDKGEPQTRLGLIGSLCGGSTPDGFALDWCSQELLANNKPGEDMVLIILSDGMPNIAPTGFTNATDHVHKVVEHFRQKGVTTISISLDPGLRAAAQSKMYRNWIQYETDQKLPMQLTKLLIKLFGGATS